MQREKILFLCGTLAVICSGCASASKIIEYDSEGRITRTSESSESVIKSITASTKEKSVIIWESGWTAGVTCGVSGSEDPTPHIKIYAGKADKGMISVHPNQQGWEGIAKTILSTREDLSVNSSGISSRNPDLK